MATVQIKVAIPWDESARIAEALAEGEALELMVVQDDISRQAWLTGFFASRKIAEAVWNDFLPLVSHEIAERTPEFHAIGDTNWQLSYRRHFRAWKFGPLMWAPVWEKDDLTANRSERVVWLDPGLAFGTGNHETTRMCCERLVEYYISRGAEGTVLDAGCGSGILALSAARLGFAKVTGFDNDALAVRVSRENAVLNSLQRQVTFFEGGLPEVLVGRRADVVLANIQADVLMQNAERLCNAVAQGGILVLSGILTAELVQVRAVFETVCDGWLIDSRNAGEWADLRLMRGENGDGS